MSSLEPSRPTPSRSVCEAGLRSFIRDFIAHPTFNVQHGPDNPKVFINRTVRSNYSRLVAKEIDSHAALFNRLPSYPLVDMVKVAIGTSKEPDPDNPLHFKYSVVVKAHAFTLSGRDIQGEDIRLDDGGFYWYTITSSFSARRDKDLSMLDWRCLVELVKLGCDSRDGLWFDRQNPLRRLGVLGSGQEFRRA